MELQCNRMLGISVSHVLGRREFQENVECGMGLTLTLFHSSFRSAIMAVEQLRMLGTFNLWSLR